jgi:hypothetical protein
MCIGSVKPKSIFKVYLRQCFSTFLGGDTHFENKKLATPAVYQRHRKMPQLALFMRMLCTKSLSLKLICDRLKETRDTQMCRDTVVENHCLTGLVEYPLIISLLFLFEPGVFLASLYAQLTHPLSV